MDLETNDLGQIHRYLAEKGRGDFTLPAALEKTPGTGCAILPWHDKTVAMVCFHSGSTTNAAEPDLFLFVIARSDVPGAPTPDALQVASTVRGFITASWTAGDKIYVLGARGDEKFIRRFL
jgi:hypothetical protein